MSIRDIEEGLEGQQGLAEEDTLALSPSSGFPRERSPEFVDKMFLQVDREIAEILGLKAPE